MSVHQGETYITLLNLSRNPVTNVHTLTRQNRTHVGPGGKHPTQRVSRSDMSNSVSFVQHSVYAITGMPFTLLADQTLLERSGVGC